MACLHRGTSVVANSSDHLMDILDHLRQRLDPKYLAAFVRAALLLLLIRPTSVAANSSGIMMNIHHQ